MNPTQAFLAARDFLVANREDYERAYAGFRWPELPEFNWALDYFDVLARGNAQEALCVVPDAGAPEHSTFAELSDRSSRAASFLRRAGVSRGDRILVMLPNTTALWEITLAAMKLGAVVSPTSTLLTASDLADRIERGRMRCVVTDDAGVQSLDAVAGNCIRILVGAKAAGWLSWADAETETAHFRPDGATRADDPFLLYFTSGTTARPKMVLHTHASYPVGHLSTMYWIGMREGDRHCNISSPGWAKHAWSSFFAPWNAGASVFAPAAARFDAKRTLALLAEHRVASLCAPPTVWRMLVLEDLTAYPVQLRELVGAGEPLNPEVIEKVKRAWGVTIRDGYGQTETTAQIANTPGQPVRAGSMGRPLPGYRIALLDEDGRPAEEGEIAIALEAAAGSDHGGIRGRPRAQRRDARRRLVPHVGHGIPRQRRLPLVRRALRRRLQERGLPHQPLRARERAARARGRRRGRLHPEPRSRADERAEGVRGSQVRMGPVGRDRALDPDFARGRLSPFQRIRRLEFAALPKTISGKIRRVELRALEIERRRGETRGEREFWEDDFA